MKISAVAWPVVRDLYSHRAVVKASRAKGNGEGKKGSKAGSKDFDALSKYVGFEAPVSRLRSHQTLALERGKVRGALNLTVALPDSQFATNAADREVNQRLMHT
jgi:transcriptional accessory protein Tex/SPT6